MGRLLCRSVSLPPNLTVFCLCLSAAQLLVGSTLIPAMIKWMKADPLTEHQLIPSTAVDSAADGAAPTIEATPPAPASVTANASSSVSITFSDSEQRTSQSGNRAPNEQQRA